MTNLEQILFLLDKRRLIKTSLLKNPFNGTIEIKVTKSGKYIYIKKLNIETNKYTSNYIDKYDDSLFKYAKEKSNEAKKLRKELKDINNKLDDLGYTDKELTSELKHQIDIARCSLKTIIYYQTILENINITRDDVESIIENNKVSNVKSIDIQKILNLYNAWLFILNKNVFQYESNLDLYKLIERIVNTNFELFPGTIRYVPVKITGPSYIPPIPYELEIENDIKAMLSDNNKTTIDKAIDLCLYLMKTQVFNDGSKRSSIIFTNHYLISHNEGFIVIPDNVVTEFKQELIKFYENEDSEAIRRLIKENCWFKNIILK